MLASSVFRALQKEDFVIQLLKVNADDSKISSFHFAAFHPDLPEQPIYFSVGKPDYEKSGSTDFNKASVGGPLNRSLKAEIQSVKNRLKSKSKVA
jgi:hypothetical protein